MKETKECRETPDQIDRRDILTDEMEQILLNTREQCEMMEQWMKQQIQVKDELITRLHEELSFYKSEAADRFAMQLMKAVIKVRKDMGRILHSPEKESMNLKDLWREYRYAFEDITDLLEQQNVDAFTTQPGEDFNPAIHQPKIEPTADPSLDKKIKKSLGEGYTKDGRLLLPERVVVYQVQR